MELRINEVAIPEEITFNADEIKTELAEKVKFYETVVYTDDQIKSAKTDRAALNRLKKALNDERIKREREYMKPFDNFKAQINEIIAIIDKPVALIDKQVKDFEEKKKADKRIEIGALWEKMERPEWLVLTKIFDEKWLNASVTIKSIVSEIDAKLEQIAKDVATIKALPEFSFEALDEYKRTLDLGKAIAEGQRLAEIQKRKQQAEAEAELAKHMPAPEEPKKQPGETLEKLVEIAESAQWVSFSAYLTIKQAKLLKEFFKVEGIEFKAI